MKYSLNQSLHKISANIKLFLAKPQFVFLLLGSFFGVFFAILVIPFRVPDEQVHFYRAYHVSYGKIFAQIHNNQIGSMLPDSLQKLVISYNGTEELYNSNPKKILLKQDTKALLGLKNNPNQAHFYNFAPTALRNPIAYVPASLGILAGRLTNAPILIVFWLARFFNLTVFIILIFFAIKIIPKYKYILLSVSLLPMSIFLAASLSIDGIIMGCALLFIACCVRLYSENKKPSKNDLLIIFLTLFAMGTTKVAYLTLAILLIPIYLNFKKRSSRFHISVIVLVVVAASIGWLALTKNYNLGTTSGPPIDGVRQASIILKDPIRFINAVNNTVLIEEKTYFAGMIGRLD